MNLLTAHHQWATRPADERFWTLGNMLQATRYMRENSREVTYAMRALEPRVLEGEPVLLSPTGAAARFTHTSFARYCAYIGAPVIWMRALSSNGPLLLRNLQHAHAQVAPDASAKLLLHANGCNRLRALTSDKYTRIWDDTLVAWALSLEEGRGWQVPPARPANIMGEVTRPATAADVLAGRKHALSIKEGQPIAPAGLYASWDDCFIFMVDERRPIVASDNALAPLYRGFFLANSTDGSGSLKLTTFLYDMVCGNHIVWNAQNVQHFKARHLGRGINGRLHAHQQAISSWAGSSTALDVERIREARAATIAPTMPLVIDVLYEAEIAPRKQLEEASRLAIAHEDEHGNPLSRWGMMSAMTRLSQTHAAGDTAARVAMDTAASKILTARF